MFMRKAVVGIENSANEYQTKNMGRWIFSLDKWKLPSAVWQDKFQNKLMSNPGGHGGSLPQDNLIKKTTPA